MILGMLPKCLHKAQLLVTIYFKRRNVALVLILDSFLLFSMSMNVMSVVLPVVSTLDLFVALVLQSGNSTICEVNIARTVGLQKC